MPDQEFTSESPQVAEVVYQTGETVERAGEYQCFTCVMAHEPLTVPLCVGQAIPTCATCGPRSRWRRVE
jgi:hypothetical protein